MSVESGHLNEPIDAIGSFVDNLDSSAGSHCRRLDRDQDGDRKLIHVGTFETNADNSKTGPLVLLENSQESVPHALVALIREVKNLEDSMLADGHGHSASLERQQVPWATQRRRGVVGSPCQKLAIRAAALNESAGVALRVHFDGLGRGEVEILEWSCFRKSWLAG